jgi:nucleoside-diphosphate-sugar epimerase
MKNILITGATGYIGTSLLKSLQGKYNFFGVVRKSSDVSQIQNLCELVFVENLELCFQNNKIDVVIHLATNYQKVAGAEQYRSMISDNVSFGGDVLHFMSQYGVKRMINSSTYFQNSISESHYSPANFYAATKQAFEDITTYFVQKEQFNIVTLVLYDVYGSNDKRRKILNILLEAIKRGDATFDMTKGEQIVHFVHINDVVAAFEIIINCMLDGTIQSDKFYITDASNGITLRDVVEEWIRVANSPMKVNFGAMPYPNEVVMKPFIGKALPEWVANVSFDEGLKMLIDNHNTL